MAEFFENKEYGDYFRRLEDSLQGESAPEPTARQVRTAVSRKRRKKRRLRPAVWAGLAGMLAVLVVLAVLLRPAAEEDLSIQQPQLVQGEKKDEVKTADWFSLPAATADTVVLGDETVSRNVSIIRLGAVPAVIAQKNADDRVSPASTTKIMTAMLACEMIEDYDAVFTMTQEITDAVYLAEATAAGFSVGEQVTFRDLLYGCILPSGGDGALGLAQALCGSEEAFVALMNQRAAAYGLKNTHFTNVVGLYDENHYSTANDMAVILANAMQNEMCRTVLSTVDYTTAATPQHPEGIALQSTLFSYMYGTEPEGASILAGKTGYVNEAGFCLATYGRADSGTEYVCVTFGGVGRWETVFDLFELYGAYAAK